MNQADHYKIVQSIILTLLLLTLSTVVMAIDEPEYDIIEAHGDIELRQYRPFIVAETVIAEADSRNEASNEGFRRLFKYITGNNTGQQKIDMTAPVIQSNRQADGKGEKIAMTAPVQQSQTEAGWKVAFVLPLSYNMETAPLPGDPRISLREVPGRKMMVLRFSGRWTDKNIQQHQQELEQYISDNNISTQGSMEFAAYNAPFALPFMRRNEVMLEID